MTLTVQQQKSTASSKLIIFAVCLTFRILNAYLTQTYDNPDEYWQSQEVAHTLVFGYGYMTWEWRERIRSFAHPLVFALLYQVIQWVGLDDTIVLVAAPRYLQAWISATADVATYSLAKRIFSNEIAFPMLFTTLCSWFNFLMAARSLSNNMEMALTMIALNYWPLTGFTVEKTWLTRYRKALVFAFIACVMRPTNALIWLFMGVQLIWTAKGRRAQVIINALVIGLFVLLLNAWIDTRIYNHTWNTTQLVFTPYQFFKVNVVNSISLFYGVHTWHWYLSQGLPVIFTTFLPFLGFGCYKIYNQPVVYQRVYSLLYVSLWVIVIYSLLPHKEFRFVYPIVPVLLMISAYGLQHMGSRWRTRIMLFLMATQAPLALYLSLWHQRGVVDVVLWLRTQPVESLSVLMPCHSTPWSSLLHKDIPMWFLTCEPPLDKTTLDQADQFYQDPLRYLQTLDQEPWPTSHLILFENLVPQINSALDKEGYSECKRFFNSHFHDDGRRRGDVIVYCRL